MAEALATKYRPRTFDDVTEQGAVKTILLNQLSSGDIKHAYLFCGAHGCGKTSCARIFANEINKGKGEPTELDAASNNGVDDVRNIIQQSKTQSMDSEYRIFIIDEAHALSNNAWQAFLKTLEEPPKKSIFIFCTTNPERIPNTVLSRIQRFDFKRISTQGIADRLKHIIKEEIVYFEYNSGSKSDITFDISAVNYIAKLADGGMRDAITMLDKCLAYSTELTVENVTKALGTVDYEIMFTLTDAICNGDKSTIIRTVEGIHADGKDLKQFIKDYTGFLLDVCKYDITKTFEFLQLPATYSGALNNYSQEWFRACQKILDIVVRLNSEIKWDTQPKITIEAVFLGGIV